MNAIRLTLLVTLALAAAGCMEQAPEAPASHAAPGAGKAPANHTSPYAGLEGSPIRGLTPKEIGDLRNGSGMSLALPAELNGYPGPRHVLDMAAELNLTADQRSQMEALHAHMKGEAQKAGREVLAAHERLEREFRNGTITQASLDALTRDVGAAWGELRLVHLRAHLDAKDLLTHEQVMRYNELRGYGASGMDHGGHAGHAGH